MCLLWCLYGMQFLSDLWLIISRDWNGNFVVCSSKCCQSVFTDGHLLCIKFTVQEGVVWTQCQKTTDPKSFSWNSYHLSRVQNEQFSEEKTFILRDTEKRIYSFRRDSNPMDYEANTSTTELSDSLMNAHKSSVNQVPNTLFTNQSSLRNCHKMTNCEQFRTKCCVKISEILTLASTDVFSIKSVTRNYNRRESWVF